MTFLRNALNKFQKIEIENLQTIIGIVQFLLLPLIFLIILQQKVNVVNIFFLFLN